MVQHTRKYWISRSAAYILPARSSLVNIPIKNIVRHFMLPVADVFLTVSYGMGSVPSGLIDYDAFGDPLVDGLQQLWELFFFNIYL